MLTYFKWEVGFNIDICENVILLRSTMLSNTFLLQLQKLQLKKTFLENHLYLVNVDKMSTTYHSIPKELRFKFSKFKEFLIKTVFMLFYSNILFVL